MTRIAAEESGRGEESKGRSPAGKDETPVHQGLVGQTLQPSFGKGLRFTCTQCGACCRHVGNGVGLRDSDIRRLERIGVAAEETDHPIFRAVLRSEEEGTCSLLVDESRCTIYESRPIACRLYPFYIGAKSDGTLQLSVDHCPGVNSPGAELVDEAYVQREVLRPLQEDASYLTTLRDEIRSRKGGDYCMSGPGEGEPACGAGAGQQQRRLLIATWAARRSLWEHLFGRLEDLPSTFSPRDRLECLKADVLPWLEGELRTQRAGRIIDEAHLSEFLLAIGRSFEAKLRDSARTQEVHKVLLQTEAGVLQHGGQVTPSGEETTMTFRLRVGEPLSVNTRDLLKLRPISPRARAAEMDYLKEVVSREFVYGGVSVPPLTIRGEASLLFYLADAVELTANAFAIHPGCSRIGVRLVETAICEVDARILAIVQGLDGGDATVDPRRHK